MALAALLASSAALADEQGDSVQTAAPIGANASRTASIDTPGDKDYFRIRLRRFGRLVVQTMGGTDTAGRLLDARGRTIERNNDASAANPNFKLAQTLPPGTYFVRVTHDLSQGTGTYRIITRFTRRTPRTVYLLVHGTNSVPGDWAELAEALFGGFRPSRQVLGPTTRRLSRAQRRQRHFAVRFRDMTSPTTEGIWNNGDGSTLIELGADVAHAVTLIERDIEPDSIVLVAHSRGGLAARAYLQGLSGAPDTPTALITIGTPHQGTPLARIVHWLDRNKPGWTVENTVTGLLTLCDRIRESDVRGLLSPSVAEQASAHGRDRRPRRNRASAAIHKLRKGVRGQYAGVRVLPSRTAFLGEVYSDGIGLGKRLTPSDTTVVGDRVDIEDLVSSCLRLGGSIFGGETEGERRDALLEFVYANLPSSWRRNTDGVVPVESQRLSRTPGIRPGTRSQIRRIRLRKIQHAEENGPDQVTALRSLLRELSRADARFDAP